MPGFVAMLCTLVIYEGAFLGEVIRGGIQALSRGQTEAARALGHGVAGTMVHVVLAPGALRRAAQQNQPVRLDHQETTLGYVVDVSELTFAAQEINNRPTR